MRTTIDPTHPAVRAMAAEMANEQRNALPGWCRMALVASPAGLALPPELATAQIPEPEVITLPGNLSTSTAGPLLCPGAPVSCQWDSADATSIVRGFVIEDLGPERVIWCSPSRYIGRDNRARVFLSLDLTADLGPTIALRWLGRHYGIDVGVGCPRFTPLPDGKGWMLVSDVGEWIFFVPAPISDPERFACRIVVLALPTNPLEALTAACLHAAGVTR